MLKHLGGATAMALLMSASACAHAQDHDHHEEVSLGRVFVGDHAKGQVTVFDLADPARRWSFETRGQAKLHPVAGGALVAAVQSDVDAVQFIRSGVELHDHGDHADIKVEDPTAVATTLSGPRPFHLVDHGGKAVINYDGGGYAEILEGAALTEGRVEPQRFPQNRAHHGFVAPLGEVWLSTVASEEPVEGGGAPPRLGLRAFDESGAPRGDLATCTAIHGEAFSGAYLAAGCKEGVLTAKAGPQGVEYEMLAYPADLPQGVTTGTLLGSPAMQVFLGNHGPDGLVVIDPVDEPHYRRISLPFRRVDFALDPVRARNAYVLTEDGSLHRVDLLSAEITASARITEPYSMEGHWNDPRPRLAVAGAEILVTDPLAGLVRRISTETLQEVGTVAVEGVPYNLTVVTASGLVH